MGYVLSAFAWSYVAGQLLGGALLDRFGSKTVYLVVLVLWSRLTMAQGLVGALSGFAAAATLFALRFLVGLAEAPNFPANARIVAAWFPARERGTASAIFNAAQYFSLVAFALLMGWLAHQFSWPWVFYVMGALGLVAAAIFAGLVHSPLRHPAVSQGELDYIEARAGLIRMDETGLVRPRTFTAANLKLLLTNRLLVGVYVGQYGVNVLTLLRHLVSDLPGPAAAHVDLHAGMVAAAPALCGFAGGVLGGVISDRLLARTGSLDIARKGPATTSRRRPGWSR